MTRASLRPFVLGLPLLLAPLALASFPTPAAANTPTAAPGAEIGKAAPDFTLTDVNGKTVHLHDYLGKKVVLEWFNPDCPFVKFAHTKGPLKDMGARYSAKGIVWLAINSSAAGKQGNGVPRNLEAVKEYGIPYPILIDESGAVGKSYGAKTTPHMYVIDEKGTLVYRGAIDNAPLGEVNGGGTAINYVDSALSDLAAGPPMTKAMTKVKTSETRSYGCSVKYSS